MTPAELRSRIARSGISDKRLADLLGIPQPNVSGWCTGIRSIPAHHVARIIELTDNPPTRTEPPWRPPADVPPSRHGRPIRAKRPQPLRQLARLPRPEKATAAKPEVYRPASASHRESAEPAQTLDLSGLMNVLLNLASPLIDGNGPLSEGAVLAGPRPATEVSVRHGPLAARQQASATRHQERQTMMSGPRHEDFVAQENARVRPVGPDAIMHMRFFKRQRWAMAGATVITSCVRPSVRRSVV